MLTGRWVVAHRTRIDTLMQAVKLAISFQEKVVRVGTALVQQKKVFSSRNFRFARLEDGGPDTQHFVQPHALTRLALFVMTASHVCRALQGGQRGRVAADGAMVGGSQATPKHKKRMPFVLSVKNMANNMYAVVGVHPPADTPGDVRRKYAAALAPCPPRPCHSHMRLLGLSACLPAHSRFSDAFKRATVEADAEHRGHGFDASVIEVSSRDHKRFLEYLQLVR